MKYFRNFSDYFRNFNNTFHCLYLQVFFDNDYAYFRNGDDYYVITAENAAYCVRTSSIYTDKFDSPSDFYVKYSFNYVVKLKNAFDFEAIKSLFNE